MRRLFRKIIAGALLFTAAATATAQAVPPIVFDKTSIPSGWSYDPAKEGMKDLRAMKPIEGCN